MNNPVDQPKVSELLPCPFCGAQLEIRESANAYGRHAKDSECIMAAYAINIPHDVERWNERALPHPQATTVGVKALEWTEDWAGSNEDIPIWRGRNVTGSYVIVDFAHDHSVQKHSDAPADKLAAKKAAAQADYDTRIRSALIGIPGAEKGGDPADNWEEWCRAWHSAVDAASIILGLPAGLGASEFVEAIRNLPAPTSERVQALAVSAAALLALRDALIENDNAEAYHQLYAIADPTFTNLTPWKAWEDAALLHEGQG